MKSRMPEIVEPKQLIQSRVLVKRARLTVKRGAARPNGKSTPPQSPLRRAVRYRIRGAARHSTQDCQRGGRGWEKITLDLPWQPARVGRQEKREKETESKGGGEREESRNLLLPPFCCLIRLCKCKLWPVLATLLPPLCS